MAGDSAEVSGTSDNPQRVVKEFWDWFEELFESFNQQRAVAGKSQLTWKQLAEHVKVPAQTFSHWKTRHTVPDDFPTLVNAAVYLGADPKEALRRCREAHTAYQKVLRSKRQPAPAADSAHETLGHGEPDTRAAPASQLLPSPQPAAASNPAPAPDPLAARHPPIFPAPAPTPVTNPDQAKRLRDLAMFLLKPEKPVLALLCLVAVAALYLVAVLAWPGSSSNHPAITPHAARCAYVTAPWAPVLAAPSDGAPLVKSKDLGNGVEILPLSHPQGWWPVYTPSLRPDHNWMRADVLSPLAAGTRPCQDNTVNAVTAQNYNGAEEQFTILSDCHVYHRWQNGAGGKYSGWASLGGCALPHQQPAVGTDIYGDMVVFVIFADHTIRCKSQPSPGRGPWPTIWTSMGEARFFTGLRVVNRHTGSSPLLVFAKDKNGQLWENEGQGTCCWSGWHPVMHP